MGDCLAVCLMEIRNFKSEDFAKYHPGGALGKKLLLRVKDILEDSRKPMVRADATIQIVIFEISEKRLGVTAVIENDKIIGIITDGDIRRMLSKTETIKGITARDIMTVNPKMIESDDMVVKALNIMEDFSITQLIVSDDSIYKGVIHLHDILKEGIV
jgi:arabinose-5-phosphate isomerase